ncbi:GNAT family N-acetyltransferase [Providencia huaxiensis]|uniref:GNAT family N-acetyltransferase n=1 Tax=Providencia huaxiensis TaxID=2027290 RepID=A0A8I2D8W0_9GAMM|nr:MULTISPECIES: GNAT family N-acetyltransferase [Providencia]MBQ0267473.1 GNAT family N-acetyltransferase [Providencia huaxiensis]MCG9534971.1 GNAT family N-acetyltransferase [Providencia huaxiensis]
MNQVPHILRKATKHDALLLHKIGTESYLHHFATLWNNQNELNTYLSQEYSTAKITADLNQQYIDWYIIENTSPIGLVKLTYHSCIPETDLAGTLLNKLYFSPSATGKGYGKIVFKLIEALAKQQGDSLLWLDVLASNNRAMTFYQSNDMHIMKEILFTSETQQSLEYIMSKTL